MWLLDVETLELHEFVGSQVPAYAILSHVWGAEEVSFSEMKKAKHRAAAQQKAGFAKIKGCCARARKDGLKWAWVDSCCIDKRSSAELSEAINSMFQWYRGARLCYVYLADISNAPSPTELAGSRWFTRGWTLQELLAPRRILFFARDWIRIGCLEVAGQRAVNWFDLRAEEEKVAPAYLLAQLSTITGIPENVLSGKTALTQSPVAQRMHWASRRETTRPEDRAYSLMGLFDISMPILYGEGLDKAFTRLQYEIMSRTPDQSILAWYSPHATTYRLLAESPDDFRNSGLVTREAAGDVKVVKPTSFFMTSLGLRISLLLADDVGDDGDYYWYTSNSRFELGNGRLSPGDTALALLHCSTPADDGFPESAAPSLSAADPPTGWSGPQGETLARP
ncbi:heterokaryon incompatibility protein-domain-containing protein [Cercophora scortea]|uniref:Heterokaryon incompatibility protein-domain-containing protein n=1 Tax=Cercophora scortea TaxID=314031 RepID=A0AAE0M387_9PEZI|nr:heterokaryon incompatibility protein-domain-containing protein [Cercophora scortea]